ncbi:[NiFe]-hydrogenase assembly chaperone HybE [Roseateles koreensis]|uniref:[NiFe]-hydrogenase assembly chaperone HybE n=1 Tax=Roseateles koreensis TaxID=2987526 RepID=A0ABT5KUM7_9BURK|nr:[NiFe]-hydrogenase assembly chaperone HybE [Roseateles koreensis]MDC8786140.1 [NiFe]-hydrogenase assembly chaperone HybE [Roseateles koreensis]
MSQELAQRIDILQALFEGIARTRMFDIPILNLALQVEAVGFERLPPPDADAALGILITPWFMSLLCLPLQMQQERGPARSLQLGGRQFEFLSASEPGLGAFSACSLFSPMGDFADPAGARATALEILRSLRLPPEPAPVVETVQASRRALFFGRPRSAELER